MYLPTLEAWLLRVDRGTCGVTPEVVSSCLSWHSGSSWLLPSILTWNKEEVKNKLGWQHLQGWIQSFWVHSKRCSKYLDYELWTGLHLKFLARWTRCCCYSNKDRGYCGNPWMVVVQCMNTALHSQEIWLINTALSGDFDSTGLASFLLFLVAYLFLFCIDMIYCKLHFTLNTKSFCVCTKSGSLT